jgi:16S rRNA (cytidine1402-2'-O)-methyltransferase
MEGKLYMIPTPIGEDTLHTIPQYVIDIIHTLDVFVLEKGKTGRAFLKACKTPIPLQSMQFFELNNRTEKNEIKQFLEPALKEGKSIGMISEAGCPGIADPGAELVNAAHNKGILVQPLVGPSSILMALMGSGMSGQRFAFQGYLPVKRPQLKSALQQLETESRRKRQTQLFIETPYRNNAMLTELLSSLKDNTKVCVACDISLPTEYIRTMQVKDWKELTLPDLHKRPTIFLIYAS